MRRSPHVELLTELGTEVGPVVRKVGTPVGLDRDQRVLVRTCRCHRLLPCRSVDRPSRRFGQFRLRSLSGRRVAGRVVPPVLGGDRLDQREGIHRGTEPCVVAHLEQGFVEVALREAVS